MTATNSAERSVQSSNRRRLLVPRAKDAPLTEWARVGAWPEPLRSNRQAHARWSCLRFLFAMSRLTSKPPESESNFGRALREREPVEREARVFAARAFAEQVLAVEQTVLDELGRAHRDVSDWAYEFPATPTPAELETLRDACAREARLRWTELTQNQRDVVQALDEAGEPLPFDALMRKAGLSTSKCWYRDAINPLVDLGVIRAVSRRRPVLYELVLKPFGMGAARPVSSEVTLR